MIEIANLSVQYIGDENGEKTAVILPISEFEYLLEDIADLAIIAERQEENTISHGELVAELKQDGILSI